jgi:pimeloyl-ACP methyl ester carboxylesterase
MSHTTFLTHNQVQLALHHLRPARGARCCCCTGSASLRPERVPAWADAWPGPVHALDFTGHGASTVPAGGGYNAEILLADADAALAHLGEVTVVGRGLGAYVALMLAGARAAHVKGAVLCDGPGLAGGAIGPTSQSFVVLPPRNGPAGSLRALRDVARPPPARLRHVVRAARARGLRSRRADRGRSRRAPAVAGSGRR